MNDSPGSNRGMFQVPQLLGLIPLIYHNQGIRLGQLRQIAGYRRVSDLLADLEQMMLFGVPPFGPADFISVIIEQDQVYLDFPQGQERPLALDSGEWRSLQQLLQRAMHFQSSGQRNSEMIKAILEKISTIPMQVVHPDENQLKNSIIREALENEEQLEFTYKSLSSREPEVRRVDPWALFQNQDKNYLIAFCHTRQSARIFLVSRMNDPAVLDVEVENPCPADVQELVQHSIVNLDQSQGITVRIAFEPGLTTVLERQLASLQVRNDIADRPEWLHKEWRIADCKINSRIWFLDYLRGFGPRIVILEPAFMRHDYRDSLAAVPQITQL
ncbi:MAG: WYL domain-containing protein [Leptospiraceae bacterium]|nr:WYL domain-containing protein [Leptospiraceae bacterium]